MKRDPSETFEGLIDTSRRRLLKALTVGSITSVAVPGTATANEDTEITIRQGGQKVATVSPITTDRSVENFYRYNEIEGASGNTPMNLRESGASKLFFYRQSGSGNPLSLVVIHDAPNDGSGGNVRFDFQPNSLPSGSWAVKDDPGESYSRTVADWRWAPCCTDGGAFRGSFTEETQVTIDPSFEDGIDTWDLLNDDGSVAASLSLTDPVTLTVESGRTAGLDTLVDEKLALAKRVTDASLTVGDVRIAGDALRTLTENVSSGAITEENATEAVRRMKFAENVSETLLVTTGPTDLISPEDSDTLVGTDRSEPLDIATPLSDMIVDLAATLAVVGGMIAGSTAAVLGGAAVATVNTLYSGVKDLLTLVGVSVESIGDFLGNDTIEEVGEAVRNFSDLEEALALEILDPARENLRNHYRATIEQERDYSVEPTLESFSREISGDPAVSEGDPEPRGDPEPGFEGSFDDAETTTDRGIGHIESKAAKEVGELETTQIVQGTLSLITAAAGLATIVFGLSGVVATAVFALNSIMTGFKALDTFVNTDAMMEIHALAAHGILHGEVTLDAQ